MRHKRYHGVLLWNDVTVDSLSVGTSFGTFSAPGTRLWKRDLIYPLFVAQAMWFGMLNVCSKKAQCMERGIEDYEICNSNKVKMGFRLVEPPLWYIKLPLSKSESLLRSEIGWDRIVYWSQRSQRVLLRKFVDDRT